MTTRRRTSASGTRSSADFCLGQPPDAADAFDLQRFQCAQLPPVHVIEGMNAAVAAGAATLGVPVSWELIADAAPRASCGFMGDQEGSRFEVRVGAGLVLRLWATSGAISAAARAARDRAYDGRGYEMSQEFSATTYEHMRSYGFQDCDAAVPLGTFDCLEDLFARASELQARAAPFLLGQAESQARAFAAGLQWIVSHELAHVARHHFSLSLGLRDGRGMSGVWRAGFELDADRQAAIAVGRYIADRNTATGADHRDGVAEVVAVICVTLAMLEVDRLRYADRSGRSTPHMTDVGRLAVVCAGLKEALVSPADAWLDVDPDIERGVDAFSTGLYFLTAGTLHHDTSDGSIDRSSLIRAGSVIRHFAPSRHEFRRQEEQAARDTLLAFDYYRRYIVEGAWNGALSDLRDVEIALKRLFERANVIERISGGQAFIDSCEEASALCELWELATRADFEAPARLGVGLGEPVVVDRTFVPCATCGRQRRTGATCVYGCPPVAVGGQPVTALRGVFDEQLAPIEAYAWEWTRRVLTHTLGVLNGDAPPLVRWVVWRVSNDPEACGTDIEALDTTGRAELVVPAGLVVRLWIGLNAALYCTHHSQLADVLADGDQSRLLADGIEPVRIRGEETSTLARVLTRHYDSLDLLRVDAVAAFEQIGTSSVEHYMTARHTLKRALAYGVLTAALASFVPYARRHREMSEIENHAHDLGLTAEFVALGAEIHRYFQVGRWLAGVVIGARKQFLEAGGPRDSHLEEAALGAAVTLMATESASARSQRYASRTWHLVGFAPSGAGLDSVGTWGALTAGLSVGVREASSSIDDAALLEMTGRGIHYAITGLTEWGSGLLESGKTLERIRITRIHDALNQMRGWLIFENEARVSYYRAIESHLCVYRYLYSMLCFDFEVSRDCGVTSEALRERVRRVLEYEAAIGRRGNGDLDLAASALFERIVSGTERLRAERYGERPPAAVES